MTSYAIRGGEEGTRRLDLINIADAVLAEGLASILGCPRIFQVMGRNN